MPLIARLILAVAGSLVGLFVAREALSFPIWQGVVAILLIAGAVIGASLFRRG